MSHHLGERCAAKEALRPHGDKTVGTSKASFSSPCLLLCHFGGERSVSQWTGQQQTADLKAKPQSK